MKQGVGSVNNALPSPLVPADVDLRGYEFMPLYGNHLFGSDFNARVSDKAWRSAVTLWWAAWNQVPAASLPDNDVALCRLADMGHDLRAFGKIKADALHGFVKCSDGRLYHTALAKWALEAWEKRIKDRKRKANFRARMQGQDAPRPVAERGRDADATRTERGQDADIGRDGTVAERGRDADKGWDRTAEGKRSEAKGSDIEHRGSGVDPPSVVARPPDEPAPPAVENIEPEPAKVNGKRDNAGQQWSYPAYVEATAKTLGIHRRGGEDDEAFKDRVYTEVQHRRQGARH